MGTINHMFNPNDEVYVIDTCNDHIYITTGKVIRVRVEAIATETNLYYDIRLDGNSGTKQFLEADVFAMVGSGTPPTDSDVFIEYQTRTMI